LKLYCIQTPISWSLRVQRELSPNTVSKALDDGDSLNQTTAGDAPGLASNPFNLRADKGLATFNVANLAVLNAL
jgi:hypothetical protein